MIDYQHHHHHMCTLPKVSSKKVFSFFFSHSLFVSLFQNDFFPGEFLSSLGRLWLKVSFKKNKRVGIAAAMVACWNSSSEKKTPCSFCKGITVADDFLKQGTDRQDTFFSRGDCSCFFFLKKRWEITSVALASCWMRRRKRRPCGAPRSGPGSRPLRPLADCRPARSPRSARTPC